MYISLKKLVLFTVTLHCPAVFWLSIETQLRVYIVFGLYSILLFFSTVHISYYQVGHPVPNGT